MQKDTAFLKSKIWLMLPMTTLSLTAEADSLDASNLPILVFISEWFSSHWEFAWSEVG